MKKEELSQKLIKQDILSNSYSLEGGLPNEALCLGHEGSTWEVYYSQRGVKSDLKLFQEEESACDYFYSVWMKILKSMDLIE